MKVITTKNGKRRIISDKSLGRNELEAVYPPTATSDIRRLAEITKAYEDGDISDSEAINLLQKL
jgi:hypothetical protein